jgi:hypothetical protein
MVIKDSEEYTAPIFRAEITPKMKLQAIFFVRNIVNYLPDYKGPHFRSS